MKTVKHVLRPERVRLVPEQFSWIDQALVQRHFIDRCDVRSAALYLFLVTVADAQGLSYYGTSTIAARLHLSADELGAARQQLMALDLIAYQAPLYHVLSLSDGQRVPPRALQLTRRADLLELELPEPDLSIYDRNDGDDHGQSA